MKRLSKIAALLVLLFMTGSCIYDYPVPEPAGVTLDLYFKMNKPSNVSHPVLSETDVNETKHDFRYVIQAFRLLKSGDFSREPAAEFIFTKDKISSLDSIVTLHIEAGTYKFYAWADYVVQNSQDDNHFNTTNFSDLSLNCDEYHGNTDTKEAFVGSEIIEVVRRADNMPFVCDTITLSQPLVKYNIVSNDLKKFISRMQNRKKGSVTKAGNDEEVNLNDYLILIIYDSGLCYTSIDLHNGNMPIDGRTGVGFWSKITPLNEDEALLGFDHIFTKPGQNSVKASVHVYDKDTTLITVAPVEIPISKDSVLTTSGEILTYINPNGEETLGDGIIDINTEFDGEINIKL